MIRGLVAQVVNIIFMHIGKILREKERWITPFKTVLKIIDIPMKKPISTFPHHYYSFISIFIQEYCHLLQEQLYRIQPLNFNRLVFLFVKLHTSYCH